MKNFKEHSETYDFLKEQNSDFIEDETSWNIIKANLNMSIKSIDEVRKSEFQYMLTDEEYEILKSMIPFEKTYELTCKKWNPKHWDLCQKLANFYEKMRNSRKKLVGNPFIKDTKETTWYRKLKAFGFDPKKSEQK